MKIRGLVSFPLIRTLKWRKSSIVISGDGPMCMLAEGRLAVISRDVWHGGITLIVPKMLMPRGLVMRTAHISHGKSLPRRLFYAT